MSLGFPGRVAVTVQLIENVLTSPASGSRAGCDNTAVLAGCAASSGACKDDGSADLTRSPAGVTPPPPAVFLHELVRIAEAECEHRLGDLADTATAQFIVDWVDAAFRPPTPPSTAVTSTTIVTSTTTTTTTLPASCNCAPTALTSQEYSFCCDVNVFPASPGVGGGVKKYQFRATIPANATIVSASILDRATGRYPATHPFAAWPMQTWSKTFEGVPHRGATHYDFDWIVQSNGTGPQSGGAPVTWRFIVDYKP